MKFQALIACSLALPGLIKAQLSLGSAATFGVLGATTVTNTGMTIINGDLGVSPGTAITGFPPGIDNGNIQAGTSAAAAAQADALKAYNAAVALPPTRDLTGQDLGGMVLPPGTYHFSSSAQLTGTLSLNANGNPNAQFVFQIGSTLTTATAAVVQVINGGRPCNIFWQIGSSATIGTGTVFTGNVVALTAITVTTGSSNNGSFIALNAAVTLDTDHINNAGLCGAVPSTTTTSTPSTTTTSTSSTTTTSTPSTTTTSTSSTTTTSTPMPPSTTSSSKTSTSSSSEFTTITCPSSTCSTSTYTTTQTMTCPSSTCSTSTYTTTQTITSMCPTTSLTTTSSTTSSSQCSTTSPAPTCEYHCGKFCSKPLASFKNKPQCQAAVASCVSQVFSCYATAGSSESLQCDAYVKWCADILVYCESCTGGSCSKGDCYSKHTPNGLPAKKSGVCTAGY